MQYMSDLHLEFAQYLPTPCSNTLLLAGDILTWKTYRNNKSKRKRYDAFLRHVSSEWDNVVAIAGNHEYYGWNGDVLRQLRELYKSYGIHFLENETITLDGVRVAGATLWTDFFGDNPYYHDVVSRGMNDYHVTGLTTRMTYDMHKRSVDFLESSNADVFLTHHAPSVDSVHPKYLGSPLNAGYYSTLDLKASPRYWVHGHMHNPSDYMMGETRVLANPRGYPNEESGFNEARTLCWN